MLSFKVKKTADSEVLEEIFEKRPLLKGILEENGGKSLAEFAESNMRNCPLPDEKRKKEFLGVFGKILERRLGHEVSSGVVAQLNKYYFASTADHHGPLNSSKFLTSNLLMASGISRVADPILKNVVVLSCSSVSLSNDDFPRGLLFHTGKDAEMKTRRLSFLPSNSHNCLVYNFRAYKGEEVKKVETALREKVTSGEVSQQQADKMLGFLAIFKRREILEAKNFCKQVTMVNYHLWRELLGAGPDLIYVELEELISQLLLECHMGQSTLIHRMIFDQEYENKLLNPLTEAMGKFVRQGYLSTYLFWGISEKNYRLKLTKVGDELLSDDKSFKLKLTPEALAQALQNKKIVPNLLTIYTILHLYYGFNCIGGFNQIHYLDAMQKVYNDSGLDRVKSVSNSCLYGYGPELLFLEEQAAYSLDLMLYGKDDSWKWIQENFGKITLNDAFGSAAEVINNVLKDS